MSENRLNEMKALNSDAEAFGMTFRDPELMAMLETAKAGNWYGEAIHYVNGVPAAIFNFTNGVCKGFCKVHCFGKSNVFKRSIKV